MSSCIDCIAICAPGSAYSLTSHILYPNQASIRRLLSLSPKLETLYLLLVPGGDPLQHRAAIRAISNAVLNSSSMVRPQLPTPHSYPTRPHTLTPTLSHPTP